VCKHAGKRQQQVPPLTLELVTAQNDADERNIMLNDTFEMTSERARAAAIAFIVGYGQFKKHFEHQEIAEITQAEAVFFTQYLVV
jgi:hypothetical protein